MQLPHNVIPLISELRRVTGLGLLEAKNTLIEANWDFDAAVVLVRKKTGKIVDARAHRETLEGLCGTYIHTGGKIAVIVEVNCETDFVARCDQFKEFCHNVAMQIAATNPMYLAVEDVPLKTLYEIRTEAESKATDIPPAAVAKLVQGRTNRFYSDFVLLEQPYIRDHSKTVKDVMNNLITSTKENIRIRRFTRYQIGQ